MTDLTKLTLADALDGLKAKKLSSREITQEFIQTIEGSRVLNAYVVETPEKALEMADNADVRLAKGEGGQIAHERASPRERVVEPVEELVAVEEVVGNGGDRGGAAVLSAEQHWLHSTVKRGSLTPGELSEGSIVPMQPVEFVAEL